jgi:protein-S-isoprenylcysteine O-methyltransferase Ste14
LWARLAIRGWYSSHLQVLADQSLITAGPYRLARHPSYAGLLLLNLGIAAGYGSFIGLLAIPLLVIPGLMYRIAVEERILVQRFGDQYRSYQKHVRRLVPGLW